MEKPEEQEVFFIWAKQFLEMWKAHEHCNEMKTMFRKVLNEEQMDNFMYYANRLENFILTMNLSMSNEDREEVGVKKIAAIKLVRLSISDKQGYFIIDYGQLGGEEHQGITRRIPFKVTPGNEYMTALLKATYDYNKLYGFIVKTTSSNN